MDEHIEKSRLAISEVLTIEEINSTELARRLKVCKQTISAWRKHGLPRPWFNYFKTRYPYLSAWKKEIENV